MIIDHQTNKGGFAGAHITYWAGQPFATMGSRLRISSGLDSCGPFEITANIQTLQGFVANIQPTKTITANIQRQLDFDVKC